jgi:transaldolase
MLKKLPAFGTKSAADLSLDGVEAFRTDAIAAGRPLELPSRADAAE